MRKEPNRELDCKGLSCPLPILQTRKAIDELSSGEILRLVCLDTGVKLIGCQMTMDVFGFSKDDFIKGVDIGGAATFLDFATNTNIQLFI